MKYYYTFVLICTLILVCAETSVAQKPKRNFLGLSPLSDTVATEKDGFFILPLIYFTPDTRWAFGGAGVYYFKIPPKKEGEQPTRISYVQFLADYTQNRQLDVWSVWNMFTRNENYMLKGELRYRNFPDKFYGIGNATSLDAEEKYAYNLVSIKNLFLKKVRPGFFAGFDYHFEYEYGFEYTPDKQLSSGEITGYRGGVGSALGLVALLDTRDNLINAHSGQLAEFSSYFYRGTFGSTFNFTVLNGIYQRYWTLKKNHILAWQTRARFSFGGVPFLDLSTLGNDDLLRGYPKNRFRDWHFAATQVEYRFPLFWRFGGVAFAGVGDVFNNENDLRFNRLKYSVGSGLRFLVNPAERINIRLDYGYGREGGYFYFMVAEAF